MRGLVPRWGGGGAWQNPRCQFAVPSHNSSFSYLGVPAPTGMSDWYENDVARLRQCLGIPPISRFVVRTKTCTPINLNAGSPRAKRAEL